MPHRTEIATHLGSAFEAIVIGIIAGWKIAEAFVLGITEQDWSRLIGPHGFTVGLILAVIVLWGNGVADRLAQRKRDEAAEVRRDARHAEQLAENRKNNDDVKELQAESIKAKLAMAHALTGLRNELKKRPCCFDSGFKEETTEETKQ
jgi:hypothetical protein